MRIDVVSIFPEYLDALKVSLVGRAAEAGILKIHVHDLRDWAAGVHRSVDDAPYGGGAGMVMTAPVWGDALDAILAVQEPGRPSGEAERPVLVIPSPAGWPFTQREAERLSSADRIVFACGRYEGIDQRVADHYAGRDGLEVRELSIGDYVINGGEAAVLVMVEAIARLVPGVIGNPDSLVEESHASETLEYPVYSRPEVWRGLAVPPVLLSGHHARIAEWRRAESMARTAERRPDLLPPAGGTVR